MKKIIMLIMALCLSVTFVDAQSFSQKDIKKMVKNQIKELKKEGYTETFGTSLPLEYALKDYYSKRFVENKGEQEAYASRFKSKNVGMRMLFNNACLAYAEASGGTVQGAVEGMAQGDVDIPEGEIDRFVLQYTRELQKEIKGELKMGYGVIKSNGDGTYEAKAFYLVDEDGASRARMRALETAAKETEAAQKWGKKIREHVDEVFANK